MAQPKVLEIPCRSTPIAGEWRATGSNANVADGGIRKDIRSDKMMMKRSALSRPEKQHRTKGDSMKRLTKSERRKQIRRFDAIRDDRINTNGHPRNYRRTDA
jgi:hypothetical protein